MTSYFNIISVSERCCSVTNHPNTQWFKTMNPLILSAFTFTRMVHWTGPTSHIAVGVWLLSGQKKALDHV